VKLFTGYTWAPQGEQDGRSILLVPTIGIDYSLGLSRKFRLGMVNDFQLSSFVIEDREGSQLEREYAYVGTIVGIYEAAHGLGVFAGPGVELEKNHNLFVVKIGLEYAFVVADSWSTAATLAYDFKDAYDSFSLGILVGYGF
jgi:hypothetical protein